MLPVGSIVMWGGSSAPPSGWLLCDGTVYEQSTYPELFDVIQFSFGFPKTGFDPRTQFFVPDFRGRFIRGVDDSTGTPRDPDRELRFDMQDPSSIVGAKVGSLQDDDLRSHDHHYQILDHEGDGRASGGVWDFKDAVTGETGGKETRPTNAYVRFIICARPLA